MGEWIKDMDLKTILFIGAIFGSNGLQAAGFSIPNMNGTQRADETELFATSQAGQIADLQKLLADCQNSHTQCLKRCQ